MTGYTLAVSDEEVRRYQFMAATAKRQEADLWTQAGIVEGAVVADVGCGPAAVSVEMARVVGPTGRVIGVERDESALTAARQLVGQAGVDNVELRQGAALEPGLADGSVDVVVMRHVLAHNGPDEQAIVDVLARLVRPGGSVYLVDVDASAIHILGAPPELEELQKDYRELHRRKGNDLLTGIRLGRLLRAAGLDLVLHEGVVDILDLPTGVRPPSWAARDALREAGLATDEDIDRWDQAFQRMDGAAERPTLFNPRFTAIGRRSG